MKAKVHNLDFKAVGDVELNEQVFGREVRADLLARAVNWQLNKRRSGNHQTKTIAMIAGTTAKPWNQKGTGRARQGSTRSPQWRGGAVIFGPHKRDHSTDLQKKVRQAALCTALSAKQAEGKLFVLDQAKSDKIKTKDMAKKIGKFGASLLFVDGDKIDLNFALSVRNIPNVCVLPDNAANVYDILRHEALVLTSSAVDALTKRLTTKVTRGAKTPAATKKTTARKTEAKKPAAAKKAPAKAAAKKDKGE
ncbi:MAG: 50S ribosomal protein L4 [Bdellovibrionales bacterium]